MPIEGATYVGADVCKECHVEKYDDWITSGHPYKLMTPEKALEIRPGIPMPEGYTKDDILYVIGGWGWKARFMDKDGYIITKTGEDHSVDGSNQYNVTNGEWVDYNAGKEVKYNCQKCHNTGAAYDTENALPGIEVTWELDGVQCEACHGPGSEHVALGGNKSMITVDTSASLCGQCHRRGADDDKIPASEGFAKHHEQYLDFLAAGKMSVLECVDCHDPHKPVHAGATNSVEGAGIIKDCEDCHADAASSYAGSVMDIAGVKCVECHMPKTSKSAVAVSEYEADIRSHLFKINTDEDAEFTYIDAENGNEYANPYITVEYACLYCHEDKDKAWAAQNAPGSMTLQSEVVEEPAEESTMPEEKTPGFGLLSTLGMLAIGYAVRRR
ncbi:MAG: hypothetical protein M8350_07295 [Methanosarcinaceae archaeon]|nr:hypothetical protein [Methanosarcinaceae archaeon]